MDKKLVFNSEKMRNERTDTRKGFKNNTAL